MAEVEPQFLEVVDTSALELRKAFEACWQEGVMGATDLKVTAGGAGLSVDVAAGVGFVQGDAVTDQGMYRIRNDATKNSSTFEVGALTPAHATLPRIDQIIARVYDQTADGLGLRKWRLEVVTGTATSGATLDNRNGAAALPNSAIRLADVLIPAAGATVLAGNVRDRRPWCRGFQRMISRGNGIDYQTTSTVPVLIDSTNLQPRCEIQSGLVEVGLHAMMTSSATTHAVVQQWTDGVADQKGNRYVPIAATGFNNFQVRDWVLPSAGSHLIGMGWFAVGSATLTMYATDGNIKMRMWIREVVGQNADNT